MLQPSRTRYRKAHRGVIKGIATRGSEIAFGDYALKVTEAGYITSRQIESARKAMIRYLRTLKNLLKFQWVVVKVL